MDTDGFALSSSDTTQRIGMKRAGERAEITMADQKNETCAHPSCNCAAAKDSKYCSTVCEGNEGRADII
ncbi:MAG TPA: hypothetical protein VFC21_12590, partial [Bryobacteraceae bacterium]|nr:hypothetical protein [Bryobacteraceae bacterium]